MPAAARQVSRILGQNSIRVADMRECLGESLLAVGQVKAARERLSARSPAIDKEKVHTGARTPFLLARALSATPADRPRAFQIARAIRRDLAQRKAAIASCWRTSMRGSPLADTARTTTRSADPARHR